VRHPPPTLDATAIVAAFNRHGVQYVVIGAYAALAQDAPIDPTRDIDFTPDSTGANLTRLSTALKELGARIRTTDAPDGLPFEQDGPSLGRAAMWNLVCRHGEFDICFRPAGFDGGYRALVKNAHRVRVREVEVVIADLDDVIRSKEEAGRPKDLAVLPALYRHRQTRSRDNRPAR